ncbi:MAG TPA: hypothetical protein VLF71_04330 [Candidatus Saccharimonadales bacterium]|nr:hypothetical protein [Candidatus Saccharimonadales bacterium]
MDKLGIVFSSRVRSAAFCVLGLWVLLIMSTSAFQVIGSYLSGGGFDAPVGTVIAIDIFLLLPYYLTAAIMLRSLAARLALYHKLRKQVVVPEYTPPEVLSPAEAGLLVDNDFGLNEIAATLKDLELRGCITIDEKGGKMLISPANTDECSRGESLFLRELFWPKGHYTTHGADSGSRLLQAGEHLGRITREELVAGGQLPENSRYRNLMRGAVKVFIIAAVLVQTILTIAVLKDPEQIFNVGYPRYSMNVSEPLLELVSITLVVGTIFSGFKQPGLADDNGLKNWRYVAGLKMYIEKVYKDRFYRDGRQMASDADMRTFYPHAIALGIEKRFAERLRESLIF